ncbi:MAG: hypothetical protein JXQ71_02375 [Verrucomicrobia bacterium]|nr:hypothetical protein [Verrucomicrobiota bacterium]
MNLFGTRSKRRLALGLALLGGLVALAFWRWPPAKPPPAPDSPGKHLGTTTATGNTDSAAPSAAVELATSELGAVRRDLAQTPATATRQLAELRRFLGGLPPAAAAAAIRAFLDSKADAPTALGFRIRAGGSLEEAPSLRVFLLDYLAQVDPAAAAACGRDVLAEPGSPDEWAVALRDVARGDTSAGGRACVLEKTAQLLHHEPWQHQPAAGYLEAFDAAVWLGGTNLVPALGVLVRKTDNPAVAHAAFLALDRLTLNDPAAILDLFQQHPELLTGREAARAGFFARADIRDPPQRAALERYLLDPALGDVELEHFAGLYPNANIMVSHNLLTQVRTPDHASLTARDAAALRVAREWLADPRFERVRPQLARAAQRLETFVRQAGAR